ncbi:hypothetical protein QM797_25795, partial [Rhodococcus sp. IEGM 1381]|uniref:hypothetical protein n=1 Tax=Rhodococcus sp. IEGM 1381 TaxID=3047085 RepID=UPI0024B83DEA
RVGGVDACRSGTDDGDAEWSRSIHDLIVRIMRMNTRGLSIFTCMERLVRLRNHDEIFGSSLAVREIGFPLSADVTRYRSAANPWGRAGGSLRSP